MPIIEEGLYSVFDSDGVMVTNFKGVTRYKTHSMVIGDFLSHVFRKARTETYPIPAEKADAVFAMIQAGDATRDIVNYLAS